MSFTKSKREAFFKQLDKANKDLSNLLDTSDKIASLRQTRTLTKRTRETKAMTQFWRHADNLYSVLDWSWRCSCKPFHLANLLLQYRTSASPEFNLLFFFGKDHEDSETPPTWTIYETQMNVTKRPEAALIVPAADPAADPAQRPCTAEMRVSMPVSPPPPIAQPCPVQSPSPKSPKRDSARKVKRSLRVAFQEVFSSGWKVKSAKSISVRWASNPHTSPAQLEPGAISGRATLASESTASTAFSSAIVPSTAPPSPELPGIAITDSDNNTAKQPTGTTKEPTPVTNLCEEIPKFLRRPNQEPPVCLQDSQYLATLSHSASFTHAGSTSTNTNNTISLQDLLRKDSPKSLTRRERYFLALALAASYLQLKSSPWIPPAWSKRDILFLSNPSGNSTPYLQLDKPYVARRFDGSKAALCDQQNAKDMTTPQPVRPSSQIDNKDRTLASLGIMLLELCFGRALEEHPMRILYNSSMKGAVEASSFFDMAAAMEWSEQVAEEAGPEFSGAVEWCLKSMPGSGMSDTTRDGWRDELLEKVVLPLKYCHDQVAGVNVKL